VGYSIVRIASPVFYALGHNRIPVAISVATVLVNAALNITLVRVLGYQGLALGTSLAAIFNAGCLLVFLRRRLQGIDGWRIGGSLIRIVVASGVMGIATAAADALGQQWMPGTGLLPQLGRVAMALTAALVVLAAAAHLLGIREFRQGVAAVTRRLGRT
jgi:putative peptidoglycan lipid II flippase